MKPRHKLPSEKDLGFKPKLLDRVFNKKVNLHNHAEPAEENPEPSGIAVKSVAVILDGKVWEVLRAQDRLAELFLAQPTFVLIEDGRHVHIGSDYTDGEFYDQQRYAGDTEATEASSG